MSHVALIERLVVYADLVRLGRLRMQSRACLFGDAVQL